MDPASLEFPLSARRQKHPWLTWLACVVCVVVFAGIHADSRSDPAEHWGWQPADAVYDGAYWALLSSVFVHVDLWHLAFNLYWLFHLGRWLEQTVGSGRWLAFVLGAGFVSSAAELAVSGGTGIGASGVGYAMFGFGWLLRKHDPGIAAILDPKTVMIFLIWLVGCVVLTVTDVFRVGNAAHFAGLLFGMAIGAWVLDRARRPFILAALVLLIIACTITLFWAPWSVSWTSWRGVQDHRNGNFAGAIKWYQRSMALGQEKKWCEDAIEMARTAMQVERFRRRRETTTNENSKLNP
jgi:GlpG protein